MYLYAGIACIVLGILIAALGFTNILPNLTTPGVSLVFLGLLFIGLNFVPQPDEEDSEGMSLGNRLLNIFVSPSEVFRSFRTHPKWIVAVAIVSMVSGVYSFAFFYRLTPEVITNHTVEKLGESGWMNAEQLEAVKKQNLEIGKSNLAKVGNVVSTFVWLTFLVSFLGLIYLLIVMVMGGRMNFWQGMAVSAYSLLPVFLIQKLLSLVILFFKDPTDIHPILGQNTLLVDNLSFLVAPSESPVVYSLLASLSITAFYGMFLIAIGLKNAGTAVSSTAGWTAAIIIMLVSLTLSTVSALLFGGLIG